MDTMDSNIVLTTITSSALFVLVIQWLKNCERVTWIQKGSKRASRVLSLFLAFVGHAGVSYVWNPGVRQLVITLPTFWAVLVYLWHVANHFALQETIYQATINKVPTVTAGAAGPTLAARVDAKGAVVVPETAKP